jgi:hypothetical protein
LDTTHVRDAAARRYEEDIDLLRYGRFLAAYWIVIAACGLAGAIALFAVGASLPAQFRSTATLALTPPADATPVVLTPASAKALVAGSTMLSETLKETGLEQAGVSRQQFVDDALDVQPVPSTNLVKLSVTLPDRAKARDAATLLARKIVEFNRRIDADGAAASLQTLDWQMADAQASLDKAQQRLIEAQTRADVEGLEADVTRLQAQNRPTAAARSEIYRRRLEIEALHGEYLERQRRLRDLVLRSEDARKRPSATGQIHLIDPPIESDQPLPQPRAQFALFGAVIGTFAGVVVALILNKRRLQRTARV